MSVRFADDDNNDDDSIEGNTGPKLEHLNLRNYTMKAEDLAKTRREHAIVDRIYRNQRRASIMQQKKAATLFKVTPELIAQIRAKETKRSDWTKCYSERQGKRYWRHNLSGMTSMERPYSNLDLGAESDSSEDSVDLSPSRKIRSLSPQRKKKGRGKKGSDNSSDEDSMSLEAIHELDQGEWHERFSTKYNAKYWRNIHTRAVLWKKPLEYRSHR